MKATVFVPVKVVEAPKPEAPRLTTVNGELGDDMVMQNRMRLVQRMGPKSPKAKYVRANYLWSVNSAVVTPGSCIERIPSVDQ
ncbi:hypothetical protein PR048_007467 [Dryococelus australis]|uniref:Uncharacterized protein n=1 Tax=Dryococelus australis TaxID=614101 RepID=A0ABQ9HUB9_9NEOP|nr:hypothetical protein PR048_007467 [Dryococelus australis]